jgi:hypothetical protein
MVLTDFDVRSYLESGHWTATRFSVRLAGYESTP